MSFPDNSPQFNNRIYEIVRLIPRGKALTYGQIAQFLEVPNGARAVGWALAALPNGTDVPWHRVINAQRKSSPRGDGRGQQIQLERLAAEGVQISADGQVAADAMWTPSTWEIRDLLESLKK